jgi:hypothetical protein
MAMELGALIRTHPELRAHVYGLLQDGPTTRGFAMLAHAVAESPDADGLLLLVRLETKLKRSFLGRRTIEERLPNTYPPIAGKAPTTLCQSRRLNYGGSCWR